MYKPTIKRGETSIDFVGCLRYLVDMKLLTENEKRIAFGLVSVPGNGCYVDAGEFYNFFDDLDDKEKEEEENKEKKKICDIFMVEFPEMVDSFEIEW